MPELPEVEIWRENLERWLRRRRIVAASVPDPILRGSQSRRQVESAIAGATVRGVVRRGKFLLLELAAERPDVLIHLGMTGTFEKLTRNDELPRFTRAALTLSRGERIAFLDVRRLGEFRLVLDKERGRLDALGVEPLSATFTASRLHELASRSKRPIKVVLMDQHKIAGIGNIHAAEALFLAKLHPKLPASELTRAQAQTLARAIRRELRGELKRSRSENLRYLQQGADNRFRIYGKGETPCPRCRTKIAKLVQDGRSTYYCPSCQPEE